MGKGIKANGGDDISLFASDPTREPLASRMRPRSFDEFIGQDDIVGPGRLLRRAIQLDRISSILLYGPPGTGKTTLARIIASTTSRAFMSVNAVLSGVADIREAIDKARDEKKLHGRGSILFVDEVHRWNKSQQDALLPWVENGTVSLVGATTENPYFAVNQALVSRSRVFRLSALSEADVLAALTAAIKDVDRGYGAYSIDFEEGALELLSRKASGDIRNALNALELAVEASPSWPATPGTAIAISLKDCEECAQSRAILYDKDGDAHYDAASALIKSVRGSDADAALYWLATMCASGEDPRFIFRRLLISACEDVGMAAPDAVRTVLACADAFDRVGLPEGHYFLAHAAIALATAPKSNSSCGFFEALREVERNVAEVPDRLKDASRDAAGLGHGEGYLYPHEFPGHWVAQSYLPDSIAGQVYYRPSASGYEATIREQVLSRREAAIASSQASLDEGGFSRSVSTEGSKGHWLRRAEGIDDSLIAMKEGVIARAALRESDAVVVYPIRDGLIAWNVARSCPHGSVVAAGTRAEAKNLEGYGAFLDACERPRFLECVSFPDRNAVLSALGRAPDVVLLQNVASTPEAGSILASIAMDFQIARIVLADKARAARLATFLRGDGGVDEALAARFESFEREFFASVTDMVSDEGRYSATIAKHFPNAVFDAISIVRKRLVDSAEVARWLSPGSKYGNAMGERFNERELAAIRERLVSVGAEGFQWPSLIRFATVIP